MSLSYQHMYHAGNLADVHKHLWLVGCVDYLLQKDKALFWLDAHSGRGHYDLQSAAAAKTAEAASGIQTLFPSLQSANNPIAKRYCSILQEMNDESPALRYYPGSPLLTAMQLRAIDRLVCCELHPQEQLHLHECLERFRNVQIKHEDMMKVIPAQLPPMERRGGVMFDPSYEIKTEYQSIAHTVLAALKKWSTGCYLIWYPILAEQRHEQLKRILRQVQQPKIIDEWLFTPRADSSLRMQGSGMVIINPPFTVPENMKRLKRVLAL